MCQGIGPGGPLRAADPAERIEHTHLGGTARFEFKRDAGRAGTFPPSTKHA
jgi:hypothetical protein